MILVGRVLEARMMKGGQGEDAYAYMRLKVLDEELAEVVTAKVADGYGLTPSKGDEIEAVVGARPYKDRSGFAQVAYTLIRPVQTAGLRVASGQD